MVEPEVSDGMRVPFEGTDQIERLTDHPDTCRCPLCMSDASMVKTDWDDWWGA